ncbi:hypothetical protein [Yunchengibacter salinarum]|uniref:hypothetical protein n=1 Tax=Yunchengibacter salinarum TaxID=3133399 RepID=UPI0035B65301
MTGGIAIHGLSDRDRAAVAALKGAGDRLIEMGDSLENTPKSREQARALIFTPEDAASGAARLHAFARNARAAGHPDPVAVLLLDTALLTPGGASGAKAGLVDLVSTAALDLAPHCRVCGLMTGAATPADALTRCLAFVLESDIYTGHILKVSAGA